MTRTQTVQTGAFTVRRSFNLRVPSKPSVRALLIQAQSQELLTKTVTEALQGLLGSAHQLQAGL